LKELLVTFQKISIETKKLDFSQILPSHSF